MERKNVWNTYEASQIEQSDAFAEAYRQFLSACKTERECVVYALNRAKEEGYRDLQEVVEQKEILKPGDRVYVNHMDKAVALFQVGTEPLEKGMNILGAHIDSPRLDIKQNPLYEEADLAYLDTHYYGGIKKYQWVTIPLALHGVIVKKDGTKVPVVIGEKDTDPVFGITDLLPHLAYSQMDKKASLVIEGEDLNLLLGSRPLGGKEEEKSKEKTGVKANILAILQEQYGVEEEDFLSAELEVVPAGQAREFGLDRSMIMGYGHDDRVCAYPSLEAILAVSDLKRTGVCLLVDKEEIGSVGATGMHSRFFENAVAELVGCLGQYTDLAVRRAFMNSFMLSSDVSAAFDPIYAAAYEKNNAAYLGKGVVFNKFTGARGKSGSNDANPEFFARIRQMLDQDGVAFQTAELGKVDVGGGGTIAYIMGNYGMNVIDSGVAVLNMHAPWEIISKVDLYESYRCYQTFLREA